MKQLTAIDTSFLTMESATTVGHVSSLTIYDPTTAPGGGGYEVTKRIIAERLNKLVPLTRKLVTVPFGLDLPYWVEDSSFDLDFHVRNHAVPPPGNDQQLGEVVARIISRPLDRSRPLWELYVIEGLESGFIAQLTKIHHATIDGASGAQMLNVLLDPDPDWRPPERHEDQMPTLRGERIPSDPELLQRTAMEYLRRPEKFLRLNLRLARELAAGRRNGSIRALADSIAQPLPGPLGNLMRRRLRTSNRSEVDTPPALPATAAPRTPWNRSISAHRRFAFTTLSLEDAKAVRRAYGSTFNDVVMALCSSALRTYLQKHDALPADPLIAMVPVSLRTGSESETYQNRVSGVFADLATDEPEPVARLLRIQASMNAAKEMQKAMPAETLQDFMQFAPPAIAARALRMYSRTRIPDRLNPPFNLIISNVPGPRQALYSAGARLEHFYPVSAVADGQGLNMTVQSYMDNLDFGFVACRELVPDVWDLTGYLHDAMSELLATV